ncbi:MAG: hypothetical protein INQ03_03645 [Candidatus Heimdallarchaeota archaeon]|nr:hypothetical protein [Candidatus Heimdallarchaeota archaeon]
MKDEVSEELALLKSEIETLKNQVHNLMFKRGIFHNVVRLLGYVLFFIFGMAVMELFYAQL